MSLKESFFKIVERSHLWSLYLRVLERGLWVKTAVLLVFFLWLVKSLKNLQTITLLITSRKVNFCLISSTVLYLLDQLHIFSILHLTKLVGILRSGATRAVALDMSRALDRV